MKFPKNLDDCPVLTEELIGRVLILLIAKLIFGGAAQRPALKPPVPREELDRMLEAAERGEVVELVTKVEVSGETLRNLRDELV